MVSTALAHSVNPPCTSLAVVNPLSISRETAALESIPLRHMQYTGNDLSLLRVATSSKDAWVHGERICFVSQNKPGPGRPAQARRRASGKGLAAGNNREVIDGMSKFRIQNSGPRGHVVTLFRHADDDYDNNDNGNDCGEFCCYTSCQSARGSGVFLVTLLHYSVVARQARRLKRHRRSRAKITVIQDTGEKLASNSARGILTAPSSEHTANCTLARTSNKRWSCPSATAEAYS